MSVVHRALEGRLYNRRGPRRPTATHRVCEDPPWVVTEVTSGGVVLLTACHLYKASAVLTHAWAADSWKERTVDEREESARKLIAQARGRTVDLDEHPPARDPEFEQAYPTLAAFLFTPESGNGKEPTTASLSLFYDGSALKMVLNDRGTDRSLWSSGLTVADAFQSLEDRLNGDFVEWRRSRARKK